MVVKDLIQFEEFQWADFRKLPTIDFQKIEREVLFTINLILNGIASGEGYTNESVQIFSTEEP